MKTTLLEGLNLTPHDDEGLLCCVWARNGRFLVRMSTERRGSLSLRNNLKYKIRSSTSIWWFNQPSLLCFASLHMFHTHIYIYIHQHNIYSMTHKCVRTFRKFVLKFIYLHIYFYTKTYRYIYVYTKFDFTSSRLGHMVLFSFSRTCWVESSETNAFESFSNRYLRRCLFSCLCISPHMLVASEKRCVREVCE